MRSAVSRRRPLRHRRKAGRRRTPRSRRTACGCSSAPICWRSAGSPTASASGGTARRTFYNYNIRLEATNVCVASCLFCSFARLKPGDAGRVHDVARRGWDKLRQRADQPLTEVHVVNGLHPDLPFDYYTELLRGFKRIRPDIHLKCFTAVEIAFFADLYGKTRRAGAARADGRGARFAAGRRRRDLRRARAQEDRDTTSAARIATSTSTALAHRLGMRTNVTMLYGHIETTEERVDHMLRARALQDETGGFQAFIPLAFHPDNNQMRKLPAPSAADTLRVHAVARLMLRQHRARQGVLDRDRRRSGADRALVRRRRSRRHRAGREDLPHGRLATPERDDAAPDRAAHPRRRPRAGRARHALQRRRSHAEPRRRREALHAARCTWHPVTVHPARLIHLASRADCPCCSPSSPSTRKTHISERQPLPERYLGLSDEEMDARIAAAKRALGGRLVILGHHYQRDEVIKFADYTGDSYKLASGRGASRRRIHRVLRRAFHGRERRRAQRRASAGDPARPRRRLLDGRHGRRRAARDVLGRSRARMLE